MLSVIQGNERSFDKKGADPCASQLGGRHLRFGGASKRSRPAIMIEHVFIWPNRTRESALVTPRTSVVEKFMQIATIADVTTLPMSEIDHFKDSRPGGSIKGTRKMPMNVIVGNASCISCKVDSPPRCCMCSFSIFCITPRMTDDNAMRVPLRFN